MSEITEQIRLLEKEIASLPVGYISKKTINGKTRFYRQWSESGKIKSKYIKDEEYEEISRAIARRKILQEQLKELKKQQPTDHTPADEDLHDYETNVIVGDNLLPGCRNVRRYQKRDCFEQLGDGRSSAGADGIYQGYCLGYDGDLEP